MNRKLFSVLLLIVLLSSCRTPQNITYFQGLESLTVEQMTSMEQTHNPIIRINDHLIINVTSPDRETASPYNPPPYGIYMQGEAEIGISAETQNLYTYLVYDDGCINFPVLGRVKIAGLTINEATRMMEDLLKEGLPRGLVNISIANFKVRIMGEVIRPNEYSVKQSSRITILDLIAMAGDLTIVGDRKNIVLIRDNNGEKEHLKYDLTDPAIFSLPHYYLQQNDVVYIPPNNAQKRNAMFSNEHNFRVSMLSLILSSITGTVAAIVSIINVSK